MLIGDVELVPLLDAVGLLAEYADAYPQVPAEAWDPYRAVYPELFAGASWRLPCRSFLVRSASVTVLVDTGVGPPGLWEWTAEREGELPDALREHGAGRDEVDVVFLTHLHIDHVGWNTDLESSVFFPRARYLAHPDAVAFASSQGERPHVRRCITPLLERFETVVGEVEIASGITTFVAPGHYPGHMGLRLESDGQRGILLADAAVHPALLDNPDWLYVSDVDPSASATTRRALLQELVDSETLVACGHYPASGIGHVARSNGRVVWEAI